jgi:hypothetical protein
MSSSQERISSKAPEYAVYMQNTDNLQLSDGIAAGTKKWQNWGWTADESSQWTSLRSQSDILYPQYADGSKSNTTVIDQMNLLIMNTKKYDNDPLTGHHLLDKIALNGTISDCETFHVKRGTALAAVSHQGAGNSRNVGGSAVGTGSSSLKPVITITKYAVGEHEVLVSNPDTPTSHALPDGIKFAKLYCFIGTSAPTSLSQYNFVGNASRGHVLSAFSDADLAPFPAGTVLYAWYIARYESNKGVLGDACGAVRAQILHP